MNLKDRAHKLKTDIPALFLALKEKETPVIAKILVGIIIVYVLSPIDLIPDFIPVLGYLDDIIIVPALIALTVKLIPSDIMKRCRQEACDSLKVKKKWVYAIPFVLVWVVAFLCILHAVIYR